MKERRGVRIGLVDWGSRNGGENRSEMAKGCVREKNATRLEEMGD